MTRANLIAASDRLAAELTPPPADAADVCPICRTCRGPGYELCWNCEQAMTKLTHPCSTVLPISLYAKPSLLREWLKFYKEGDETQRREFSDALTLVLTRWVAEHVDALTVAVGGFDVGVVVPSKRTPPPHALQPLLAQAWPGLPLTQPLSLGPGECGHRQFSDDAFVADGSVAGRRVLLVDDVYTTGGTAQSAASALGLAGAAVAGIVTIGRRINPGFSDADDALWRRQRATPFRFTDPPFWRH